MRYFFSIKSLGGLWTYSAVWPVFLTCNQSLGTHETMFLIHVGWCPQIIELIKYSFVLHHQHGGRASQELAVQHGNDGMKCHSMVYFSSELTSLRNVEKEFINTFSA